MNRTARIASLSVVLAAFALPSVASAQAGDFIQPAPSTRLRAHPKHDAAADVLEDALDNATLRPDQRAAVDAIRKESRAKHAAVKRANKTLLDAVSSQIEDNAFDGPALRPKIEAALAAAADDAIARRAALDKLHVVLDKAQREALVDRLTLRESDDAESAKAELQRLGDDLSLSSAQKKSLGEVLKDHAKDERAQRAEAKEHERRVLEAFKGDKFVAEKLITRDGARADAEREVSALLGVVEALLPSLTVNQRQLAVTLLRDRANGSAQIRL